MSNASREQINRAAPEAASGMRATPDARTEPYPPRTGARELPSSSGKRVGNYKLVRELGRGGMGVVYLAERADGEFRQRVALKLIKHGIETDSIIRRFRHERQILATLDHPNIAALLDGGTTPDMLPYFVMEFVGGESLRSHCLKGALGVRARLEIFRQICSAVAYAHERHIIHCDIKPGNILMAPGGTPKLLDFGLARILDSGLTHDPENLVSNPMCLLTPAYASPEQVRGEEVKAASDIYSLGVLLYELLTGIFPYAFSSRAPREVARVICETEPLKPSLAGLLGPQFGDPDALDYLILTALQKEPKDRYASVRDFESLVERVLSEKFNPPRAHAHAPAASAPHRPPTVKSLAIMPLRFFHVVGGPDETRYALLGVGLADALTTQLCHVRQIAVHPTGSVLRAAERYGTPAAGAVLGVDYVLDGHLQLVGERLRVTVQLLKVADSSVLWASHFDERDADIFQLQDSISAKILASLVPQLTSEERESVRRRRMNNSKAFEAYMRGRIQWHKYTIEGINKSVVHFHHALAHEPTFALAHSGIADYHNWMGVASVIPPAVCFTAAKEAARKAIELDARLGEAYASLAFATWAYDWNCEESEQLFRHAFELNPHYAPAHEWFALMCSSQARHDEAIAAMKRAEQLDPQSPGIAAMFALCLHNARRYEEALRQCRRALEIDPNYYVALQGLGWSSPALGKFSEAVEGCRRAVAVQDKLGFNRWALATTLAVVGEHEEARRLALELEAQTRWQCIPPYYLALIYANLGEPDTAFAWLDRAFEGRDYWTQWLRVEPRFDPIREDTRFQSYVEKLRPPGSESSPRR